VSAELRGQVVWITGGARDLGRALALRFAEEGADIAFSYYRSRHEAETTETDLHAVGARCLAVEADLRRVDQIRSAAAQIDGELGRIDVLINNAGVFFRTPFEDMTEGQVDELLSVNFKAALFAGQEAAKRMNRRGGGSIINIGSVGGLVPWSGYTAYCSSKAAVMMATRTMALALAPRIRVNAVAPGILSTPAEMDSGEKENLKKSIPLGDFGRFDDVVEAAVFLTKSGRYITGETLVVDGGRQLK
jgi:3-oxoacyl-[acyl-carrier protein] reductase/pteridine reductase